MKSKINIYKIELIFTKLVQLNSKLEKSDCVNKKQPESLN
jgi:hypothetical protein